VISTVDGGVGAGSKSQTCGITASGGRLYVANGDTVRAVNARTNRLTTPAGTGGPVPHARR
jgi:DNA-binding beta-propeller fold protein YncE